MILVVGNINYDILLPLDRFPGPHEKMSCDQARTGFGGSAANTAFWLAKLGARVSLAGAVGRDALGDAHLASLNGAGVDTRGVTRAAGSTGVTVIFSLGREKRMVRIPGANMMAETRPDLLSGCEMVYLSGGAIEALTRYARLAKEKNIPVIWGHCGAGGDTLTGLADGFILNADEARAATGLDDPEEAIRALRSQLAAVTLPTGGCLVSEGSDVYKVTAPEKDPVDRTGGGDAFAAGFLAALSKDLEIRECGEWGNMLAGKVIMEVGARPEITLGNSEFGFEGE